MPTTLSARPRAEPRTGGVFGAATASALMFAASQIHEVLVVLAVVSPFPLLLARLRSGLAAGLASAALAGALVAVALSGGRALGYALFLVAPTLLIAESLARGRGMLRGCGLAFGALLGQVLLLLVFAHGDMQAAALRPLAEGRTPQFAESLRQAGLVPEQVERVVGQFALLQRVMEVVYPAFYVILAAGLVLANALLLRLFLAWRDPGWLERGEFERVRWPLGLPVLFVLSGAAVAVPVLRPVGYNLLLVTAFFFGLQGLAVVAFYGARLAGPPLLRLAVLLLVLANPWAKEILVLLGLFDQWADFRRFAEPPPAEPR